MIETLRHFDEQWFLAINNGLASSFLDWLCPYLRNAKVWIPLYVALFILCWSHFRKNTIWVVGVVLLLVLLSDQISANLIKNLVQRARPCRDPHIMNQVRILVHCGSGFSFISAHATNHFALAIFFAVLFIKKYKWFLPAGIVWALAICFSQVYVGVHFPFDVLCGGLLGSFMGFIAARLLYPKLADRK